MKTGSLLQDSYVIGRIEEWMEKGLVQVPVDKHYVAGFFCDVVIREVWIHAISLDIIGLVLRGKQEALSV